MAFMDFLFGSGPKVQQASLVTPEQQQALTQLLQSSLGQFQNPQAGFEPIAQRARSQFQSQTIPSLAERFTSLGGQRSSAFTQQLGQAGSQLEEALAALAAQFGQQQQNIGLGGLQLGSRPQFENLVFPGQSGFVQQSAKVALPLLLAMLSGGASIPATLGAGAVGSQVLQGGF